MRDVQAAGESALTADPDERPEDETGRPDEAAGTGARRTWPLLAVVAVVLFAADLATKTWVARDYADQHISTVIPHVLDIRLTRNAGAAFGLGAGATAVFSVVAVAVIVIIVRTASRLRSVGWAVCLGLLLGGAVGNLGDRLFRSPGVLRGRVVDWIHLHHWPVFNLADSGIVVGGILAVLLALWGFGLDGSRTHPDDPSGTG
ncbi:MAG TPA: signal peptidase II [Mycobacteriales bacterium]|nr:signal peptidase II [Mycobacteriales bacterium]